MTATSDTEHLPADDPSAVTGYYEGQKEALTRPPLAGEPGSGAIFLAVIDEADDHFLVTFDRPGRIEIGLVRTDDGQTRILAHAYEGSEVDVDQEPVLVWDGTVQPPAGTSSGT